MTITDANDLLDPVDQAKRRERIEGLRELADWLEQNPTVPVGEYAVVGVVVYGADRWQVASVARASGTMEKQYYSTIFEGKVKFSGNVRYEINASRDEVCVKRVVGTRHVDTRVIEAHDEEIVEWDCKPILGS